ncbi:PfkB family carbohydrate kinase [Ureaplasma ceti]|uniref:PfkB family carbohydrate kinase n=1 Tax=Ureaplasma ceti TaxID=3119530 RepID=UPI00333EE9C3
MKILVIGAFNIDINAAAEEEVILADSNPGKIYQNFGGVAKNIAENLVRLGFEVDFVFNVGSDQNGKLGVDYVKSLNITPYYQEVNNKTDTYLSVLNDHKEMIVAINDMVCVKRITIDSLQTYGLDKRKYDYVVCDATLNADVIKYIMETFDNVYFEAVSAHKVVKILPFLDKVQHIKMNKLEALTLFKVKTLDEMWTKLYNSSIRSALITDGANGSYYYTTKVNNTYQFETTIPVKVKSVSGAGDAFISGFLYADACHLDLLKYATAASKITLESPYTNNPELSPKLLENEVLKWKSKF